MDLFHMSVFLSSGSRHNFESSEWERTTNIFLHSHLLRKKYSVFMTFKKRGKNREKLIT